MENKTATENNTVQQNTKFCKHCGAKISAEAVICTHCGCQVEEVKRSEQSNIVITNTNTNSNTNNNVNPAMFGVRAKNKWVAFFLCLFLGYFGAHKFYEGKIGGGILFCLPLACLASDGLLTVLRSCSNPILTIFTDVL